MKEIFSKLSLYDMLVMLIPGGTILVFIALSLDFELYFDTFKMAPALAWTIMLTLAYLIGIVNHIVTSVLWSPFRDCPHMIENAKNKVYGIDESPVYKCGKEVWIFLEHNFLEIVLIVIAFSFIGMFLNCDGLNNKCGIYVLLIFYALLLFLTFCEVHIIFTNNVNDEYYESYYYVLKNRYSDDIPIMEGQVAFMQSMIIPLLLLALLPCEVLNDYIPHGSECCVRWLLISLIVLMILAIILRQRKIYERVWEDAKFLKLLQQKNADKNC